MTLPAAPSQPLLNIAVMGAGAVGCYFGALLARAGHAVTLIGRPAHVQAVLQQGLRLQTAVLDVQVPMSASTEASAVQGADVVLFCVKSSDSEDAARQIRPHLAPGALVLTLQTAWTTTSACAPFSTPALRWPQRWCMWLPRWVDLGTWCTTAGANW